MMANAVSVTRLLLALPFTLVMLHPDPRSALVAGCLFLVAITTDVVDGMIARRSGTTSALGRMLDHTADFAFVTSGLSAASLRGAIPWLLPLMITLAFLQYVVGSFRVRHQLELRMSWLGRWNGILYFVPLGGEILARLGLPELMAPAVWVSWALVVTTLVSIGERLGSLQVRSQEAPGSHDAGRRHR
jgi:phosphatidylglycerophosphate synthase